MLHFDVSLNLFFVVIHLCSCRDLLKRRQDEIGQVLVLLFYDISRSGSEDCGGAVVDWLLETVAIPGDRWVWLSRAY